MQKACPRKGAGLLLGAGQKTLLLSGGIRWDVQPCRHVLLARSDEEREGSGVCQDRPALTTEKPSSRFSASLSPAAQAISCHPGWLAATSCGQRAIWHQGHARPAETGTRADPMLVSDEAGRGAAELHRSIHAAAEHAVLVRGHALEAAQRAHRAKAPKRCMNRCSSPPCGSGWQAVIELVSERRASCGLPSRHLIPLARTARFAAPLLFRGAPIGWPWRYFLR